MSIAFSDMQTDWHFSDMQTDWLSNMQTDWQKAWRKGSFRLSAHLRKAVGTTTAK